METSTIVVVAVFADAKFALSAGKSKASNESRLA